MSHALLDDLVFQAGPLGEAIPAWPPDLSLQVPIGNQPTQPSGKVFQQSSPLFSRRAPLAAGNLNWPAYCGLLRDLGIMLQTSFESLAALSDVNVPMRLSRRAFDEGFDLQELESAEAVEISCVANTGDSRYSRLPLETSAWHELKQLIDCIRPITGPQTPIGISLLAGDVYTDVGNALAARVDFVILESSGESKQLSSAAVNHLAWSVVAARIACQQSGSPKFPLYVDAPLTNFEHLIKLLALGASAVSIDALAAVALPQLTPTTMPVPKGLLSGIGSLPVKSSTNVEPLTRQLNELINQLHTRVFQQQLSRLSDLNRDQLRAVSELAGRVCNVKLLEHDLH